MKPLLFAVVCLIALTCQSQSTRVATIIAPPNTTNTFVLQDGEAARVATVSNYNMMFGALFEDFWVTQSGYRWHILRDDLFQGPATFYVGSRINGFGTQMLTLEVFPVAFDPGKTLIVPQGSNAVSVAMECSTNLVNWTTATNGVYGTPDAAKFFRVKVQP